MSTTRSQLPLPLAGVPEGLVAVPLLQTKPGPDGERVEVRNRRRQRKTDRVELVAAAAPVPLVIDASEQRWLLGAGERKWSGITSRYRERAWQRAVELARGGVVRVRCDVDELMAVAQPPLGWVLTDDWEARRKNAVQTRELSRQELVARAGVAAHAVQERCPELAEALRSASSGSSTTAVLVFAAEDLVDGVVHAGPRAFSQAHFEHTKVRDDASAVLLAAGVPDDVLVQLGIRRSVRLGVAGPIIARVGDNTINLPLLDGPVLLRADQRDLTLTMPEHTPLVVVENLQAAQVLADQMPELAVLYTAGMPSRDALAHIAALAADAGRVLVIPDADLGGVRIAELVLGAAPHGQLLDVGSLDHPQREPWAADSVSLRDLNAALDGPAAALAQACLTRGYPVEQEMLTAALVRTTLASATCRR
jgi:hypothetical protein